MTKKTAGQIQEISGQIEKVAAQMVAEKSVRTDRAEEILKKEKL